MKNVFIIFILFFSSLQLKAQLLFYQNTYKGGISVDGKGYEGFDCLQSDSIIFKNSVAISSVIKKAYLIAEYSLFTTIINKDSKLPFKFNGNNLELDSSDYIISYFPNNTTSSIDIRAKDVTSFVVPSNNTMVIPSQNSLMSLDINRHYIYDSYLLVLIYESNSLSTINVSIHLNNILYPPASFPSVSANLNLNNLNPVNTSNPVGLSIWTNDILNESDSLGFSIGSNYLGSIYSNSGNNSTMPGSFYYQNNNLFGLVDDSPNPFIDSTDALADIKGYILNNSTGYTLTSSHINNNNATNAFIMAYTTLCPARSNKDTTINYTPICSGGSLQLNINPSVGSYTWSAANNSLNNYNIPSPVANPTVTTTYIALIDSNGCKHTEHFKVSVYTTPKTDSVKTAIGICGSTGGTATIVDAAGSPTSYTVNGMMQSSPTYTNLPVGTYTFAISNNNGCSYTSPKPFIIRDTNLARASFFPTPNTGCLPLSVYCANMSNNIANVTNGYVWYVNGDSATTQNLNYIFQDTGKYNITLLAYETFRTCSATITQMVNIKDCPPDSIHITVPNIFSPNADGINDSWQLVISSYQYTVSNYQCTVYDRWGIKVFETSNLSQAWDGRSTGGLACSAGAYFYIIKLTATNSKGVSEQKDFKGYLELVR
jgi:gliding motility-associated-like protein